MWRELLFHNNQIRDGIQRALGSGLVRINPDTKLIEISPAAYSMAYNTNWLFFGHNTSLRDCFTWHTIMFNCHDKYVPEFCKLRCYKVVVKCRNFADAMHFRNAAIAAPQNVGTLTSLQGKVGKDVREYTDGFFNGFIYCDGLADAQEKFLIVRELLDKHVPNGRNIPAIIKRTCTEFEMEHGPTDGEFWQSMTEPELELEHRLMDIYKNLQGSTVQADWQQNKVIYDMLLWANSVTDKSWMQYFGCEDFLTMKAVTYHENLLKGGDKKKLPVGGKKLRTKKRKTTKTKEK